MSQRQHLQGKVIKADIYKCSLLKRLPLEKNPHRHHFPLLDITVYHSGIKQNIQSAHIPIRLGLQDSHAREHFIMLGCTWNKCAAMLLLYILVTVGIPVTDAARVTAEVQAVVCG